MDTSPQRDKDEAQTEHFLWFVPTRSSLRVAGCAAKGVLAMLVGLKVGCLWLPCHAGTLPRLESPWAAVTAKPISHPAREGIRLL